MGDPRWARPEHDVEVSAFYIEQTEVTKGLWYQVYNWAVQNGYSFDYNPLRENGKNMAHTDAKYLDDYPITGIHWLDMLKWCNARSEMTGLVPAYYTDPTLTTHLKTGSSKISSENVKWRSNGYRLPTEAE